MRRVRSNFRPQVNVPKAKKTKKDELSTDVPSGTSTTEIVPLPTEPESSSNVSLERFSTNAPGVSVESETSSTVSNKVAQAAPTAPRISPVPQDDSSSSEDEGVIDPYDPNNPLGTRERDRAFKKNQRLQKTFNGGKPTSMVDYIFYNPKTNPMTYTQAKSSQAPSVRGPAEEDADEPEEVVEAAAKFAPTVQLKIGPDGSFQVDEKSLVLETTEARKGREKLSKASVSSDINFHSPARGRVSRIKWTDMETVFFYKCLATVGTDFEMISKYFPGRTRHHIKLKYKMEEKTNSRLITKALNSGNFDVTDLQHEYLIIYEKARAERERKNRKDRHPRPKGLMRKIVEDEEENKGSSTSEDSDAEDALRAEMLKEKRSYNPVKPEQNTARQAGKKIQAVASPDQGRNSGPNPVMRQLLSSGLYRVPSEVPTVPSHVFLREASPINSEIVKEAEQVMDVIDRVILGGDGSSAQDCEVESLPSSNLEPLAARNIAAEASQGEPDDDHAACSEDGHDGDSENFESDPESSPGSSDSEVRELEYLTKAPEPTRFGRLPKQNKLPVLETPVPVRKRLSGPRKPSKLKPAREPRVIKNPFGQRTPSPAQSDSSIPDEPNSDVLNPGTLLVFKNNDPSSPNKVVYKVFMIPPDCGGTTVAHNEDGSVNVMATTRVQEPTNPEADPDIPS